MKNIAITGMAAKFAHFNNIDRIDRALYIGENIEPSNVWQSDECLLHADKIDKNLNDLSRQIDDVLLELCSQTKQAKNELSVFVVSRHSEIEREIEREIENGKSSNHVELLGNNLQLFFTLNEAMTATLPLLAIGKTCAIIGLEQADVAANASANVDNTNEVLEGAHSISFDRDFNGYKKGHGISGILLENVQNALVAERYIYAQIKAFNKGTSLAQVLESTFPSKPNDIAPKLASQVSEINYVSQVGLVEVSSLADITLASFESQELTAKFNTGTKLNTAISCVKSVVGNSGGFSEVLSLVRSCLALQQRYIPNIASWKSPKDKALSQWQDSNFYVAQHSKTWFREEHQQDSDKQLGKKLPRQAGYSCLTKNSAAFFLLEEPIESLVNELAGELENQKQSVEIFRDNGFLHHSDFHLFILSGSNQAAIENSVLNLRKRLAMINKNALNSFNEHIALRETAKQLHANHQDNIGQRYRVNQEGESEQYTVVLLADSLSLLNRELDRFEQSITNVFTDRASWKTPNGSYFTANPLGHNPLSNRSEEASDSGVAFLYPGIGATYLGLGRDLLRLFPDVFPSMTALSPQIEHNLKDKFLNPRSVKEFSFKELKSLDSELRNSLVDIAEAGVAYACLYSQVFENTFSIKANFAAGYSMGEVSMYAALGCWQEPELMSERLANSPIFTKELAGQLNSAPKKNVTNRSDYSEEIPLWETYSVKAKVQEVEPLIAANAEVFCTIVNTEDNLLLAGTPNECKDVIDQLNTKAMPLNMPNIIHCELAHGQYNEMLKLYHLPMAEKIATKLYSSSCYLPIPQHSKAIAVSIAKCLCQSVDFPKLVNRLNDDGARLFIEMGAGRSLSGWVDKIIASKNDAGLEEHLSLPINAKGTSDEITFFRSVAKLVSHGVGINLSRFFEGSLIVNRDKSSSFNAVQSNAGQSHAVELNDDKEYITNAGAKALANTNNN